MDESEFDLAKLRNKGILYSDFFLSNNFLFILHSKFITIFNINEWQVIHLKIDEGENEELKYRFPIKFYEI